MTDPLAAGVALAVVLIAVSYLAFSQPGRVRQRLQRFSVGPGNQPGSPGAGEPWDSGGDECVDGLRDTAMMLELVAAMLDTGSGIGRSLALVAATASRDYSKALRPVVSALAIGADWETAWRSSEVRLPGILELRDALGFAALTGAPSSAILYAQAARLRRERFRAAEKRAASLGVKLVIPLGLCSLPAFICLGVVPVLLALVPSGT
ncbi:type II secretion system F family protein [Pseudarthrobacter sulfonivorans]|uniref:type II secretion system F family protein n=1 Tax=Pseudarthrobacter sulfonivorans TaxID=121292 RepID=UPI00285488F9|nr:type II secretion system F family protein [Pseudarthrobacter sulfonivorans]MDR6415075.1 pilus assembly protein TadC [Pseudarthrobacter sulfonivorans]